MAEEWNVNNREDEMNAYRILLQRHLNDDRLMGERNAVFLTSSSILFLAFIMLPVDAVPFRIFVASLGIIIAFLAFFSLGRTAKGLHFWIEAEKEIEREGQSFTYMRKGKIEPHRVFCNLGIFQLGHRWIYVYILPFLFIVLWTGSIIWVICSDCA